MLLRKTTWFWKSGLAAISFVLILSISECSDAPPEGNTVLETVIDVQDIQAEYWNYTEEGYLMFSGVWYSEELYILIVDGVWPDYNSDLAFRNTVAAI